MMAYLMLLLAIILIHIIDDFHLQGILSDLKQKKFWEDYCDNNQIDLKQYRNDYKVSLAIHAIQWSIMVHLPVLAVMLFYGVDKFDTSTCVKMILSIALNSIIHALIDDLKANKCIINLVQDQLAHAVQIIGIFVLWSSVFVKYNIF